MANEPIVTVIGNLTADPALRYLDSGKAVVNFTVASTPRTLDRNTNQWKNGEALFLNCSVWDSYAENVAESLQKGMQVIVQGKLAQRTYTDRDGQERTSLELKDCEVGPALRWAKAQVQRTPRRGGGGFGGGQDSSQGGSYGGSQVGGFGSPQSSPAGNFGGSSSPDTSQGTYGAPAGGQAGDPWGAPGNADFDQDPPF